MDIKMIVMDWAGTTVDYGCFAPVHAFAKAFEEVGITPTMQEIRDYSKWIIFVQCCP